VEGTVWEKIKGLISERKNTLERVKKCKKRLETPGEKRGKRPTNQRHSASLFGRGQLKRAGKRKELKRGGKKYKGRGGGGKEKTRNLNMTRFRNLTGEKGPRVKCLLGDLARKVTNDTKSIFVHGLQKEEKG